MKTGSFSRTDLNQINHVVQNTQHNVVKDIIIGVLRDEFAKDSYYRYVADSWGFPKTPDLTDKSLFSGFSDDETTRIFIGEAYRHNVIYYPAVLVKYGSINYVPISLNREKETIKYEPITVSDSFGNSKIFNLPTHYVFAGAWEGTVNIEVITRDILSRDEISSFCMLLFQDIRYEEFLRAGIAIKSVSASPPTESLDRKQEPLYKETITLNIRSEWRREIPVESIIDAINFVIEFGRVDVEPETTAHNLSISTTVNLLDAINNL